MKHHKYEIDLTNQKNFDTEMLLAVELDILRESDPKKARLGKNYYVEALQFQKKEQEKEYTVSGEDEQQN